MSTATLAPPQTSPPVAVSVKQDRAEVTALRLVLCRRAALPLMFQQRVDAQRRKIRGERVWWIQAVRDTRFCKGAVIATPSARGGYKAALILDPLPASPHDAQWARGIVEARPNGSFKAQAVLCAFVRSQLATEAETKTKGPNR